MAPDGDKVTVTKEGRVTWKQHLLLKSDCPTTPLYFPKDRAQCMLQFASSGYNGNEVRILS